MSRPKSKGMGIFLAAAAGIAIAGAHGAKSPVVTTAEMTSPAASNVALGERMAAAYGWTGSQWNCLDALWTRESGWQLVWNRQGSGAFGIPQALPASRMASAGADYMTSARTEIRWGLRYVADRYGDPCGAWRQEVQNGWY